MIDQKSKGDNSTQIAVQKNYTGLSPADATQMAIAMFREYYPQLKQEALQDAEQMVDEKLKSIPPEKIVPPSPRIAVPTISLRYEDNKGDGIDKINCFSNVGELVKCEYPLQINTYFNNLIRLGLVEHSQVSSLSDRSLYEPLKNHPHVVPMVNQAQLQKEYNQVKFKESYIFITGYGKAFCEICIANIITIELLPIPGI